MPSIALDDVTLFHTREPSDKQDVNVVLLDSNIDVGENNEYNDNEEKKKKLSNNCKNIWIPISAILVLIIFFIPMSGLMAATKYQCDKYPENVIVTPYSNIIFGNSTNIITQPCYYPVSSDNLTATVLCSSVDYQTKYYCPTGYNCLVDASVFPAPYLGCVSFETVCSDLSFCVNAINSLPENGSMAKSLSITYSPVVIAVFILGGNFFATCTALAILVYLLTGRSIQSSVVIWVLLVLSFMFVIISGGFFFSMDVPVYDADCYSDQDMNNTLSTLNNLNLGYLEVFIFAAVAAFFYIYFGCLLTFTAKFWRKSAPSQTSRL